jgi:hypothetical protein
MHISQARVLCAGPFRHCAVGSNVLGAFVGAWLNLPFWTGLGSLQIRPANRVPETSPKRIHGVTPNEQSVACNEQWGMGSEVKCCLFKNLRCKNRLTCPPALWYATCLYVLERAPRKGIVSLSVHFPDWTSP